MSVRTRPIITGALSAVVVIALGVGAYLYMGDRIGPGSAPASQIVVAFAMDGEDRAEVAQLIAVVDLSAGAYSLQDASRTVSIPGTSYTLLRDAYPFGGAEAVAAAIDGGTLKSGTRWVDVPQDAWRRLVDDGVEVAVTEPFETFDEVTERYTEFAEGTQTVSAEDLWGVVNGVAYLSAGEREAILKQLAASSLERLSAAGPGRGISTDLDDEEWSAFVGALKPPIGP